MPVATRKKRKSARVSKSVLIAKMEETALSGEQLKELAKKFPPPQQWYDEDATPVTTSKRR